MNCEYSVFAAGLSLVIVQPVYRGKKVFIVNQWMAEV